MFRRLLLIFATVVLVLTPRPALPQPVITNRPAPRRIIYYLFFRQVDQFNANAASLSPTDPEQFRSFFQREIGLNSVENEFLKQTSSSCLASVVQQDQQAKKLIDGVRAQYPGGRLGPGQHPPPVPDELKAMQANRDVLMDACIVNLASALSNETFAKVDSYVANVFGRQVSASPIFIAQPGINANQKVPR